MPPGIEEFEVVPSRHQLGMHKSSCHYAATVASVHDLYDVA